MLLFDVLAEAEREGKLLLTSAETERVGKCKPCHFMSLSTTRGNQCQWEKTARALSNLQRISRWWIASRRNGIGRSYQCLRCKGRFHHCGKRKFTVRWHQQNDIIAIIIVEANCGGEKKLQNPCHCVFGKSVRCSVVSRN